MSDDRAGGDNGAYDGERTLLIADDDAPFRQRLARAMEGRGFIVRTAATVAEAIAAASDPPAFADRYGRVYRTGDGWGALSDTPFTAAEGRDWYVQNEAITVEGVTYRKYGLPRVYGPDEFAYHAEYDGVGVFEEVEDSDSGHAGHAHEGATTPHARIFVLLAPGGCEFQPYQAE